MNQPFNIPDDTASFSIFALARSHRVLAAQLLRKIGLYPGQEIMLMQLGQKDEQSQNSLGNKLRIDHSTVAKSVKRLEDAGFVLRKRSIKDKRITNVVLTDKGKQAVTEIAEVWELLEKVTLKDVSEDELRSFISISKKMTVNVERFLDAQDEELY
ncbi:MarR family winged helix-turn-helix transcriptional regulator [Alkalicoccobacillus murimartini]|uniref:DNA-binding MarR family transcriptional regulator n=1 Tax=Alkalicoccobacillus murimartini TaxID=171685 RepID=A0ABT9YLC1_9BACI|nr:MarR family winged helix-turn-helix transcriptional regulator [Alkalicoccobacillus murimartini]MDQ0208643.1 DNA-binding MarR family transcriptional regulator [Alkalicoccobacillus murimartini]